MTNFNNSINRQRLSAVRPWQIVAIVALVYVLIALAGNGFVPKNLAIIGATYDPANANSPAGGYDGQFAYQIAHDPANGWQKVDLPAYRYQRILYPIAARVLGLGQSDLIDWMLIVVNLIALVVGTFFTERLLAFYGASRWYALAYGLNAGTLMSARLDLTEPLAYGLVLAGLWSALNQRWRATTIMFALAALTKETTLIFAAGVAVMYVLHREWRKLIEFGLIVAGPFAAWQGVLLIWFGRLGVSSGGLNASPFQIVPLLGLWLAVTSWNAGFLVYIGSIALPMVIIPTLIGLRVSIRSLLQQRSDLATILLFLNAAVMLILPETTYGQPIAITRVCIGLILALLIYAAAHGSKRGLNYSLLWILTLLLFNPVTIVGDPIVTLVISAIVICIILVEWILHTRHAADAAGMIT